MDFPTHQRQFTIGSRSVLLETVADSEALLDALIQRGPDDPDYQDEVMPYWADLWHSALGLARFLEREYPDLKGKEVIELGCGLGLPGIVAAMLGARVTFTDYVSDALRFAELNLQLNLPTARAEFLQLDWRSPNIPQKYDLVLAADVAYEERFFQPLYRTIGQLLKPAGACWLSEPGRAIARDFLAGFTKVGFSEISRTSKVVTLDEVSREVGILGVRQSP